MISDSLRSWADFTWVKQTPNVRETAREAFLRDIMKHAIVSLPFKTRQYFQYKYAPLFIKAGLLKTVTSPRLYTLISVNPNGFIFQSYLFNLSVIPNV